MVRQSELWELESESWYERNKAELTYDKTGYGEPLLGLLWEYQLHPAALLDVGCANGYRAAALQKFYNCRALGVDLSQKAIADGKARYPEVIFHRASATSLPLVHDAVDLVVVNFVFHCLAREYLLLACAEIDRVLRPGGVVAIADFAPDVPVVVPWKHREGLYTYKLPDAGAGIFLATGLYRELGAKTYSHDKKGYLDPECPSHERARALLLRKDRR